MNKNQEALERIIRKVISGRMLRQDAAELLGVSLRTVHSYIKRFLREGQDGLLDHRRGHFRKLNREQEIQIVACKKERPYRSARWIRDWLKLPVSPEAVRQILLKHRISDNGALQMSVSKEPIIDSDEGSANRTAVSRARFIERGKFKPAKM